LDNCKKGNGSFAEIDGYLATEYAVSAGFPKSLAKQPLNFSSDKVLGGAHQGQINTNRVMLEL